MNSEHEEHDSRAELFDAIGHPTRIKILQVLHDEPMGFADLKRAVGVESSGNMSFHLTKLKNLVRTAPDGNYVLTDDGREALWSVGNITGTRNETGPGLHVRRTGRNRQKILVPLLVVALLLLGSVATFQQEEIVMQGERITSQQSLIGLYVNQDHQFANGQGASLVIGQGNFSSNRPTTSQNGINNPVQALFDPSGNLWVVDTSNFRVVEFIPPFSTGMGASLVIGQKSFATASRSTSQDGFGGPSGVPYSHLGRYARGPSGAAFDLAGNLWVADLGNNRILEFKPPFATGMSASLVIGQINFSAALARSSRGGLSSPTAVAFDSIGNLWVMDTANNRVLEFVPPFISGMNASLVIGQPNFDSNLPSLSRSRLNPLVSGSDLAIDPSDNLWVGDKGNNRILEFKPPFSNGMNASLVIGQPDFATNNGFGDLDTNYGFAVAFDPGGNLWATFRQKLLQFRPPFSTNMQASLEIGQPDITSDVWVGGQNGLSYPVHPGFDSSGDVWVPDDNNRVLEFVSAHSNPNLSSLNPTDRILQYLPSLGVISAIMVVGVVLTLGLLRARKKLKE